MTKKDHRTFSEWLGKTDEFIYIFVEKVIKKMSGLWNSRVAF